MGMRGNGSGGNANEGEWQRGEASLTCLLAHPPAAHLMLCSRVLKRWLTGSGPMSGVEVPSFEGNGMNKI